MAYRKIVVCPGFPGFLDLSLWWRMIYFMYIKLSSATMRTLIDIPDRQIQELAMLCEAEKISRAELIRRAISAYLDTKQTGAAEAFGLWKARKVDGLAYQEQVRAEW